MVAETLAEPSCKGSGRIRGCDTPGPAKYDYEYSWAVSTTSKFSPREVMDIFKENPHKIFPFEVAGCDAFTHGSECTLKTGIGLNPNGKVGVSTTATSVTFTVIERGYFDGPGSTIKFSTYADAQGFVYLRQQADAHGVELYMAVPIWLGSAQGVWDTQQQNLQKVLADAR